jgi:predicted MFS family arabinose efflux permease
LVNSVGFGWTVRIIAFICLAVMLLAIAVLKQRPSPNKPRQLIDWSAFQELRFNLFCLSQFFLLAAAYIPFYYLPCFAQKRVGMSESLSYNMLTIMSTASVFGRIFLGAAAVIYGVFPVVSLFCLLTGMLVFIWGSVHNLGGVVSFGFFYGMFSGGLAGLQPIAAQHLAPIHLIGTRAGMILIFDAVGVLVGNPIAGAILNSRSEFEGVQAFGGSFLLVGGAFSFWTYHEIKKHEQNQSRE